jgi:competence protein ComEC
MRLPRILVPILLVAFTTDVPAQAPILRVHFVDVGQGDGVLVQSPSGQNFVYDGGDNRTRMRDYLASVGVDEVGLVVASHNHADHIGGLPTLIRALSPSFYMDNGIPSSTTTYGRVLDAARDAGSQLLDPTARRIMLGVATLAVIPPPKVSEWEQNGNSIAVLVEYGAFRLSLAGDAEPREWAWWRSHGPDWLREVQVHKASHHGSSNGDTALALERLSPEVIVVSAGAENEYGHPSADALNLYATIGAKVYRTDLDGTVIVEAESSGAYTVRSERNRVPANSAAVPPVLGTPSPTTAPAPCINVNAADWEELQRIIHIGPSSARDIIELRRFQRFRSVNDLARLNRIGPARLRDIVAEGKACVL